MKMKRIVWNMLGAAAVGLLAVGCEKESGSQGSGPDRVSPAVLAAFEALYPGAEQVRWEVKGDYAVANFYWSGVRAAGVAANRAAWFENGDGAWSMTETDIRFDQLPEAVKRAFAEGEYADWRVDEVDMLDRDGVEVVYVVEVERDGREMDLYYSADGVLVKSVADAGDDYDYGDFIPSRPSDGIGDFIASRYPGARVIDVDAEYEGTEVELIDADRVKRELFFDRSDAWQYTKTELRRSELPQAVTAAWEASDYSEAKGYRLDDADLYETASEGTFYRLELESRRGDVKVKVTPEGELSLYTPQEGGDGAAVGADVEAFIRTNYPGAVVLEKDSDDGFLEVEIRHDGREKELLFNGAGEWVKTSWEVRVRELPAAVTDAIRRSDYAAFGIDGADFVETPDGGGRLGGRAAGATRRGGARGGPGGGGGPTAPPRISLFRYGGLCRAGGPSRC